MFARLATVLLFTILIQPLWTECTGCLHDVIEVVRNTAKKVFTWDYIKEISPYKNYSSYDTKKIPSAEVSSNGDTLLVGEFYKKEDEQIGNDNSKCKCKKIDSKTGASEYVPQIWRTQNECLTPCQIDSMFFIDTTIWKCSNDEDRKDNEKGIEFLRIVNVLISKPETHIEKIERLNKVEVTVNKKKTHGGTEISEATIIEIKYLDMRYHERVKYLGRVKIIKDNPK